MSVWDKQEWIKTILSKSGTEIKEVKEENKDGWLTAFLFKFVHLTFCLETCFCNMKKIYQKIFSDGIFFE